MDELIRTNNAVVLSLAKTLLKDAGIGHFLADENMSILINISPLVADYILYTFP